MMAQVLHDWLGPMLEHELEGIVTWKRKKLEASNLPAVKREDHDDDDTILDLQDDDDLLYTDNGSTITMRTSRALSKGNNSFLQIVKVSKSAP